MEGIKADFMAACGLKGTQTCISLSERDIIANEVRVRAIS